MPSYGTAESIQALSKDAAKKFYNKWYIPTKMVQVVVGKLDDTQVHGVAERIKSSFNTKSLSSEPQYFHSIGLAKT
uniref:Putative ovule protein n=1 Tax=Solanum chacoense TaxID=4108 RepID=A0A0V0H646_SOLCH